MRPVPRRRYEEKLGESKPVPETDLAERTRRVRLAYYAAVGGVMGAWVGSFKFGPIGFMIGGVLGSALVYYGTLALSEGAGALMGKIYHPSGKSTPRRPEYSDAQALVLRGLFQEAIDCYQGYAAEYSSDPEPCAAIARIYRDHLGQYQEAVSWFRRARLAQDVTAAQEILFTREIIETYISKLGEPRRAIPELARLADRFAGTREGELAKQELKRLREQLRNAPEA
ncbi:hypothetical protein HRbin33_01032 [bacterium HR33]|nr:hypothetical protein HRbin33_01032 [bacterium HR33]